MHTQGVEQCERPTIVVYTTVYAPWEDGADERETLRTSTLRYEWERGWDPPVIDWAIEIMDRCHWVTEPSAWPIAYHGIENLWFSGADYEHPYTGDLETCTVHLEGMTAPLRWAIVLGVGHRVKLIGDAITAGRRYDR